MVIDTLMALWNLGLKGKVARALIGCLLVCFSIALLLFTVGLPAFSSRSVVPRGGGEGSTDRSVDVTTHSQGRIVPTPVQDRPPQSAAVGSAPRCASATVETQPVGTT